MGASGLSITGVKAVGFLVCYELMTGTLHSRILPGDCSHTLGALLVRLMTPADTTSEVKLRTSKIVDGK